MQTINQLKFLFIGTCLLCVTFSLGSLQAQEVLPYGTISLNQLGKTSYEEFPNAEAIILFHKGEMGFTLDKYFVKHHHRIHILSEEGLEAADQILHYYGKNGSEKIDEVKAQTITLEDGEIKLYPVNPKQIFNEKDSEGLSSVRFSLPQVKVGSVIEFSYTFTSKRLFAPDPWFFQAEYPTLLSTLSYLPSPYISYVYQFIGNMLSQLEVEQDQTPLVFTLRNIPAIKAEPFTTTVTDFMQRLYWQVESYIVRGAKVTVMKDWNQFSKDLLSNSKVGKALKPNKELSEISNQIASQTKNEKERIRLIYEHILDRVEWNGLKAPVSYSKSADVYASGKGNSAEINCLLANMLRAIGIEADPLLISTRSHGMVFKDYPRLHQFNHLICHALVDGKSMFFDAVNPTRPYNLLASNDLSGSGWLLSKKSNRWVNIPNRYTYATLRVANMELKDSGELLGSIKGSYIGYAAMDKRQAWLEEDRPLAEDFAYALWGESIPDGAFTEVKLEEIENINKSVSIEVQYEGIDFSTFAQDLIYINPMLWFGSENNPFQAEERSYPVDFGHKFQQSFSLSLKLPDGYSIESLPESITAKTEGGGAIYEYKAIGDGGNILITKTFMIQKTIFQPSQYPALQELFEQIRLKEGQRIVLRRKLNNG